MNYNILVTGCGGDIGQSIGKILKSYSKCKLLVGCDMNVENPSLFIYDNFHKISACSSAEYKLQIDSLIKEYAIDLIIPISEPELRFYTTSNFTNADFGCPLLMANRKAREIGFDKFSTANFLKDAGLIYPLTELFENLVNPVYPFLIKSRFGSGSKALFIVKNEVQFLFYKSTCSGFIAQELLENDHEEYTCGLFKDNKGDTRHIILRRTLAGGHSSFGEVVKNNEVSILLEGIAKHISLRGSINVQLRLTSKGPVVFEINPRFSSTIMFRHMMGFEDLVWSIEDIFDLPLSEYKEPKTGTKFYKGFMEYVK